MNKKITIYEVVPRDGFQNIGKYIPLETKMKIVESIIGAGVSHIQLTSFVSPKVLPQLRDATELTQMCLKKFPNVNFFTLVPNLYGARIAWEMGIRKITYVVSLSKSHNKANINRSHEESYNEFLKIRKEFPDMEICLDLATAFGCPFEGKFSSKEPVKFIKNYIQEGVHMIDLCDTIGIANPIQVRESIYLIQELYPSINLMVHIHDTRNMGMVNTFAAIECGVTNVQSSLGGLGGCPFAPGASGNLSTEDLAYMLDDIGYDVDVDIRKLIKAAKNAKKLLPEGMFSGHQIEIE